MILFSLLDLSEISELSSSSYSESELKRSESKFMISSCLFVDSFSGNSYEV